MTHARGVTAVAMSVTAALLALTTTACGTSSPTPPNDRTRSTVSAATKTGTGEVRHDLDPLTKRFTALGAPVSATWMSGTLGGEAPGPSTYWIDAVVELDPEVARSLASETGAEETTEEPAVVDDLAASLPDGPLLAGPALDARFAESGFVTTAYLDVDDATLVLVSLGE